MRFFANCPSSKWLKSVISVKIRLIIKHDWSGWTGQEVASWEEGSKISIWSSDETGDSKKGRHSESFACVQSIGITGITIMFQVEWNYVASRWVHLGSLTLMVKKVAKKKEWDWKIGWWARIFENNSKPCSRCFQTRPRAMSSSGRGWTTMDSEPGEIFDSRLALTSSCSLSLSLSLLSPAHGGELSPTNVFSSVQLSWVLFSIGYFWDDKMNLVTFNLIVSLKGSNTYLEVATYHHMWVLVSGLVFFSIPLHFPPTCSILFHRFKYTKIFIKFFECISVDMTHETPQTTTTNWNTK